MADTKFSALASDSTKLAADEFGRNTGGTSRKMTFAQLFAGAHPSFLVAANDANVETKAIADFVCDGTADDVEIQLALDAITTATPLGGLVTLSEGTFIIAATITIDEPFVTIQGTGLGTFLKFPGTTVTPLIGMADTTVRQKITIRDLRIESTDDGDGVAIDMNDFTMSLIDNLEIQGVNKGIELIGDTNDSHYNHIQNTRIDLGPGTTPIGVHFKTAIANWCTNVRVKGGIATGKGFVIDTSHTCSLINCDVETGFDIAIDILAGADGCSLFNCYCEANLTNLNIAATVEGTCVFGGFYVDAVDGDAFNIVDGGIDTNLYSPTIERTGREILSQMTGRFAYKKSASKTAVSNVVTSDESYVQIATSGSAQTVDEINTTFGNFKEGELVFVKTNSATNACTIQEGGTGAGSFQLAGGNPITLDSSRDFFLGMQTGVAIIELLRAEDN